MGAYLLLSMTCNYLDAMEMNWGEKGKGKNWGSAWAA
jgi:hypothetical protein